MQKIFTFTSNTTSDPYINGGGRTASIQCGGTSLGGGTLTLEISSDGENWSDVAYDDGTPLEITDFSAYTFDYLGSGQQLRATLTGATSPNFFVYLS